MKLDFEQTWDDWKNIVTNKDGTLNLEQIKKELYDYSILLKNVSLIFDHITGGHISKPFTDPKAVMQQTDEHYRKIYEDEDPEI